MDLRLARVILPSLVLLLCAGCGSERPLRGRHNILLLSIDTLRADHLGAYGYPRPTSPELDALAAQGVLFERPSAQAPSTLLSHTAIFTSQIPQHHGASHVRYLPLADSAVTLAETLAAQGYETASYNSGGQLASIFGLGQGFEIYEKGPDPFHWAVDRSRAFFEARRARREERPFFLFLHTYEVHHPYTPSPVDLELFAGPYSGSLPQSISIELLDDLNHGRRQLAPGDLEFIVAAYDAEIRSVDRGFGRLVEMLRRMDLLDDTLLVVTSDHGEEFGEHGLVGWHSHSLYEEMLWVPLIFRLPGMRFAGRRPAQRVRSIDIAPTLLDLVGLEPPPSFDGLSLVPLFGAGGSHADLPAIAFRDGPQGQVYEALTFRRWKLDEGRLFDLENDPGQKFDRLALESGRAAALTAELRRLVDRRPGSAKAAKVELAAEEIERLRSLGYVAGSPAWEGKGRDEP